MALGCVVGVGWVWGRRQQLAWHVPLALYQPPVSQEKSAQLGKLVTSAPDQPG
jgi:hypothetical protein